METLPVSRTVYARIVFRGPHRQCNGLAAAPEGLWVCDQLDNIVHLVRYEDGAVLTSFRTPARNASGIAWGAGSVWVASNIRPSAIYRHDPATGHCLAALILPDSDRGGVHGIEWWPYRPGEPVPPPPPPRPQLHPRTPGGEPNAGPGVSGTLWVTRPGARIIQHLDAETGDVLGTIPFPAPRSHGLYWDDTDGSIVCVETNTNVCYRLDPDTGAIRDAWRIEGVEAHGLTRSTDGRVWVCDAATNSIAVLEL
jgi:streptogramin lyase